MLNCRVGQVPKAPALTGGRRKDLNALLTPYLCVSSTSHLHLFTPDIDGEFECLFYVYLTHLEGDVWGVLMAL